MLAPTDVLGVTRTCIDCKTPKSVEDFYTHKGHMDGRGSRCIPCSKVVAHKKSVDKQARLSEKLCPKCKRVLPIASYKVEGKKKYRHYCADCRERAPVPESKVCRVCKIDLSVLDYVDFNGCKTWSMVEKQFVNEAKHWDDDATRMIKKLKKYNIDKMVDEYGKITGKSYGDWHIGNIMKGPSRYVLIDL